MNNSKPLTENTTYEYTDIDGDTVVGTLQEIGDALIRTNGDWRLQDNAEPWYIIDDFGDVSDRDFTVEEWVAWASKFEDRLVRHIDFNLKQLKA